MKIYCSLEKENSSWTQIGNITFVIIKQETLFLCSKLLRFKKSREQCAYYCMSLTYFPQMDGYETLFADDFYYVCLLCWFPIMVEWYAKKLTASERPANCPPPKRSFFLPLSGNTVRWSFLMRWIMFGTHQILTK